MKAFLVKLVAIVRDLLQGEALRLIGYGAVVVVFIVSRILVLTGTLAETPSLDSILASVTGAIALVVEFARKYVYSQNSVAAIVLGVEAGTIPPIPAPGDVPGETVATD